MKFAVALEPGTEESAWGAVVPDLPGCHTAGDTRDEVLTKAREAIELFVQILALDGESLPPQRLLTEHQASPDYPGWEWLTIDVDVDIDPAPAG